MTTLKTIAFDLRAYADCADEIEKSLNGIGERYGVGLKLDPDFIDPGFCSFEVLSKDGRRHLAEEVGHLGIGDAVELISEVVSLFVEGGFYTYLDDETGCAYRAEAGGFASGPATLWLDLADEEAWENADAAC